MKADPGRTQRTQPITGIRRETGFACIARVGHPELSSHSSPSEAKVLENGVPLPGPANALHDDIRRLGGGRYSFWKGTVYFSTSDNSDPLSNQRVYAIQYTPALAGEILAKFPIRVQTLFLILSTRFSENAHNLLRAILPPRLRLISGRVYGRIRVFRLAEIPWELLYWLCFSAVFIKSIAIGGLLPRRKIDLSHESNP